MKRLLRFLDPNKGPRRGLTAADLLEELEKSAEYKQVVAEKQSEREEKQRQAGIEQASLLSQVSGMPSGARMLRDIQSLPNAALDALLEALDPYTSVPTLYDAFTLVRRCGQPESGAKKTIATLRRVIAARSQSDSGPLADRDQGTEVIVGEALQAVDVMASKDDIMDIKRLLEDRTLGIARVFLVPAMRRLEPQTAQAYLRNLEIHRQ